MPLAWSIECLPVELLGRILSELGSSQLPNVEAACKRFRNVVVEQNLWSQLCIDACPSLQPLVISIQPEAVGDELRCRGSRHLPGNVISSAFYKRLAWRLGQPPAGDTTLLAQALSASSTDNPEERVDNVLSAETQSRGPWRCAYWSSAGSDVPDTTDWLAFRLSHPLSLVHSVALHPFRAYFQPGAPLYAPRCVALALGGPPCFWPSGAPKPRTIAALAAEEAARRAARGPDGVGAGGAGNGSGLSGNHGAAAVGQGHGSGAVVMSAGWRGGVLNEPLGSQWTSESWEVEGRDELQVFRLPQPVLCVGGHARVALTGRRQRQAMDDQYYVCVAHVRLVGVPIPDFVHVPGAGLRFVGEAGLCMYGAAAAPVSARLPRLPLPWPLLAPMHAAAAAAVDAAEALVGALGGGYQGAMQDALDAESEGGSSLLSGGGGESDADSGPVISGGGGGSGASNGSGWSNSWGTGGGSSSGGNVMGNGVGVGAGVEDEVEGSALWGG